MPSLKHHTEHLDYARKETSCPNSFPVLAVSASWDVLPCPSCLSKPCSAFRAEFRCQPFCEALHCATSPNSLLPGGLIRAPMALSFYLCHGTNSSVRSRVRWRFCFPNMTVASLRARDVSFAPPSPDASQCLEQVLGWSGHRELCNSHTLLTMLENMKQILVLLSLSAGTTQNRAFTRHLYYNRQPRELLYYKSK